ncbi:hypothetical protein V8E52_002603 [Russula decolorans]
MLNLTGIEDSNKDKDTDTDMNEDEDEDKGLELACGMDNDKDDNVNELDALSGEEQAKYLEATVAVKEAVTKLRRFELDNDD